MRLDFATTAIQASVTSDRDALETAYDRLPDATLFWGMIDLVGSANFRLTNGPKEGYIRGETFFGVVRASIAPCSAVRLLKEMGDAVFLVASELRPMLEAVIMVDQVVHQMAAIAGSGEAPFSVRAAVGFGTAKRLVREHEDFLGLPIDRLARVMGVRSKTASIVLDDEAYRTSGEILGEYASFLVVSESRQVPEEVTKGLNRLVYYRELAIDRSSLLSFDQHFAPWRELVKRSVVTAS